jgi:hypothetical protein
VVAPVFFGPLGPGSKYHRFMAKGPTYYLQVARDCDPILKQHPVGSGALQPYRGLPGSFLLSAQNASLPPTIRALQPDTIILSSNRVYVGFGVGRLAWGLSGSRMTTGPIPGHCQLMRTAWRRDFMRKLGEIAANLLLLATPVYAQLSFLSQWPGAPEPDR